MLRYIENRRHKTVNHCQCCLVLIVDNMRAIFLTVLSAFSINACYRPRGRQRHEEPAPSVCLEDGPCYKGSWMTTSSGTRFGSFQAIRYGQAPVGELRFRSSLAFMEEAGVTVDVSGVSEIMCPQYAGVTETTGQEDCLMLNIYVPEQALSEAADKRSVMVWVHGGGLTVGSNAMNTALVTSTPPSPSWTGT